MNSKSVVVEMDDNIDEEMIAVLLEPSYVENFALCNTEVRAGALRGCELISRASCCPA